MWMLRFLLICVCVMWLEAEGERVRASQQEVAALQDLHQSAGGEHWLWKNETEHGGRWNFTMSEGGEYTSDPCDDWQGVECIQETGDPCNMTTTDTADCHILRLNLFEYNLTGSVPSSLGYALSYLQELTLWRNSLSNSIPSSLGLLTKLVLLDFDETGVEGRLPTELSSLKKLRNFYAAANRITGTLPPEFGSLLSLRVLFLYKNSITGPLPESYGQLTNLEDLIIYQNRLTGTIPRSIGSELNKMRVIFLQGNFFTGSLDANFFKYSDVETMDITNNRLTGTLPSGLFEASNLQTLAMSINCFSGSLPQSLCSAQKALVLALDGLGAAESCPGIEFPITEIKLFNTLDGTVPPCVWNLPNLSLFHIAGNGLTGTLPEVPLTSQLKNLSLAHNKFSGTIPDSLQRLEFVEFDLSYNRFTGEYNHGQHEEEDHDLFENFTTKLVLEVNRLSGSLEYSKYSILRVLNGNLFGCDYIPDQDGHSDTYACGSQLLNDAMSSFTTVGFTIFMILAVLLLLTYSDAFESNILLRIKAFTNDQLNFAAAIIHPQNLSERSSSYPIVKFGQELLVVCQFTFIFFVAILIFTSPIYVLKAFGIGESHLYQYGWFYNLVYMRGVLIAVVFLTAYVGLTLVMFAIYYKCDKNREHGSHEERRRSGTTVTLVSRHRSESKDQNSSMSWGKIFHYLFLGALNLLIVVVVNGAYIFSTYQNLPPTHSLWIQIGLALFKVLYNLICVPLLTQNIRERGRNIAVRSILNIFNNLFIPCMATAFTSPTCYQGLIREPHKVFSSYSFSYCYVPIVVNGTSACQESIISVVDIAALLPPFNYNYQCGSVILTSYIPVFIYGYSFQLIIPFFFVALTFIDYETLPKWMHPNVHGLLWPTYWLFDNDAVDGLVSRKALPDRIIKVKFVMSQDIIYHVAFLCTFGVCSPFLATIISVCVIMKLVTWVVMLGRFLEVRAGKKTDYLKHDHQLGTAKEDKAPSSRDDAVVTLGEGCIKVLDVFDVCIWPIIWSSSLFFAVLTFDIAADEVGAVRALWIPLLCVALPAGLQYFHQRSQVVSDDDKMSTVTELNSTVSNPVFHREEDGL